MPRTKKTTDNAKSKAIGKAIRDSGWFNIDTPEALALNTGILSHLKDALEIDGQNVIESWELMEMCASLEGKSGYDDVIAFASDKCYYQCSSEQYAKHSPLKGSPGNDIVDLFCYNNKNVPHAYEANFLFTADVLAVACYERLVHDNVCGANWAHDVKAYYEMARDAGIKDQWKYTFAVDKRLDLLNAYLQLADQSVAEDAANLQESVAEFEADQAVSCDSNLCPTLDFYFGGGVGTSLKTAGKPLTKLKNNKSMSGLIAEIGDTTGYPPCMACHQN